MVRRRLPSQSPSQAASQPGRGFNKQIFGAEKQVLGLESERNAHGSGDETLSILQDALSQAACTLPARSGQGLHVLRSLPP
jgi:hypothetical protein